MKKLFLFSIIFNLFLVGCSSTHHVENPPVDEIIVEPDSVPHGKEMLPAPSP